MTPDEVRTEIDRLLGSIGLDTAPWAQQLLKSANSKNIDISEWNTFILKVAEVAASASTLQRIAELLAQDLDINIRDGDYETTPNAIYQNGGSEALSPYAAGLGRDCVAGGKGFAIKKILLKDGTVISKTEWVPLALSDAPVIGYELYNVEGLKEGQIYSVRLSTAAYNCGKILKIDDVTNRIEVENPPQIKSFKYKADDPENGFVANVLTIKGHPELGHINVGFNAFSTGNGNYVSERNGFSSGTDNYVLGCNGASFGRENVAGYDALVWGRGNKALVDQSAVGGRFAKQSAHALLTLGNGSSESDRKNAFEVLSTGDVSNSGNASVGKDLSVKGSATFAGAVAVGFPTLVGHAVNGTALRSYLGCSTNATDGLVIDKKPNNYAVVGDNVAVDFSQNEIIQIPSVVDGYPVYKIAQKAFKENTTVKKVIFHKGLSSIDAEAFYKCNNLTYIALANTIQNIGSHAFRDTNITQVSLPRDVVYIGKRAFYNAPITNAITIPQSCKYIGWASVDVKNNNDGDGKVFGPENTNSNKIPAIIFEGKPLRIHSLAFFGCTCDIYVPWSEGEVSKPENSAWGSKGKVHYNYSPASPIKVVQGLGDSAEAVMSQAAVTTALESISQKLYKHTCTLSGYAVYDGTTWSLNCRFEFLSSDSESLGTYDYAYPTRILNKMCGAYAAHGAFLAHGTMFTLGEDAIEVAYITITRSSDSMTVFNEDNEVIAVMEFENAGIYDIVCPVG